MRVFWTREHTQRNLDRDRKELSELPAFKAIPGRDDDARISLMMCGCNRFIGFAEWHLNRDADAFKFHLSQEARIMVDIGEHYWNSDAPIEGAWVSTGIYDNILSGLAAGDWEASIKLAELMRARDEIEMEENSPFTRALGYALKAAVLGADEAEQRERCAELMRRVETKQTKNYKGYALVLTALLDRDLPAIKAGFVELLAGHRQLSRWNGRFGGLADEALCIWGIGLANLCRWRGLDVDPGDPLIPTELLVPVGLL